MPGNAADSIVIPLENQASPQKVPLPVLAAVQQGSPRYCTRYSTRYGTGARAFPSNLLVIHELAGQFILQWRFRGFLLLSFVVLCMLSVEARFRDLIRTMFMSISTTMLQKGRK